MRVIITGAAGEIGRQLIEECSESHELCLIDRRPVLGRRSMTADLSKHYFWKPWRRWLGVPRTHPRWMESFKNADVVCHLAGDQRDALPERQLLFNNMQMTLNVIEAAVRYGVPRVVFASSNWAVKAIEHEMAPSCYLAEGEKIGSEAPPRPVNYYGLSKAFGEFSGRVAVDKGQLESFIAVRIGSFLLHAPGDERRHRWIGAQDLRSLLRRCVEAQLKGYHVVYGVSGQVTAPYDLSHTRRLLCWSPQQQPCC